MLFRLIYKKTKTKQKKRRRKKEKEEEEKRWRRRKKTTPKEARDRQTFGPEQKHKSRIHLKVQRQEEEEKAKAIKAIHEKIGEKNPARFGIILWDNKRSVKPMYNQYRLYGWGRNGSILRLGAIMWLNVDIEIIIHILQYI